MYRHVTSGPVAGRLRVAVCGESMAAHFSSVSTESSSSGSTRMRSLVEIKPSTSRSATGASPSSAAVGEVQLRARGPTFSTSGGVKGGGSLLRGVRPERSRRCSCAAEGCVGCCGDDSGGTMRRRVGGGVRIGVRGASEAEAEASHIITPAPESVGGDGGGDNASAPSNGNAEADAEPGAVGAGEASVAAASRRKTGIRVKPDA